MRATEKDLEEIVGAIRSVADPAAIILFGSQARGEATEDSDIDLLVVRRDEFQEGESRHQELGQLYDAVSARCRVPKDILLFTEAEVIDWRGTLNHPIARALREGRILYGQV
jgi:predicted nucleotidyltransferase